MNESKADEVDGTAMDAAFCGEPDCRTQWPRERDGIQCSHAIAMI